MANLHQGWFSKTWLAPRARRRAGLAERAGTSRHWRGRRGSGKQFAKLYHDSTLDAQRAQAFGRARGERDSLTGAYACAAPARARTRLPALYR